jgi:polar amino acid transport system substrate-binding protein
MVRSITRHVVPAVLIALATAAMAIPSNAIERDGQAQPLIVAVAESPPFAIQNADGVWSGLSVDLWREIADQLQLRYDLREVDLARIADLLRDRTVDAGLGAIAVSAEGEAVHDFSQPYHATGLSFAERSTGAPSWRSAMGSALSPQLLVISALIVAGTILVGILIAVLERRHNAAEFGGPLRRGVASGVWWAAVTISTVGYGDTTPKTASGRSLAMAWMFVGAAALSIFTATVTSILTVSSLQSVVHVPSDLFRLRLGAVGGGGGAEFLAREHHAFTPFRTYEDALDALAEQRVDALVANRASLRYLVNGSWHGVLRVSPIVLEPISYAVALTSASPLRESIDQALLRIIEEDRWRDVERQYLGRS